MTLTTAAVRSMAVAIGFATLAGCARPQHPAIGSPETLDVASWNVEQFGNAGAGPEDAGQLENVKRVIERAGVDLWALQEISNHAAFERLLSALGDGWGGIVDAGSSNLHLAYVYRTDVIRPRRTQNVLRNHERLFAGRPPFLLEAEVTLAHDVRSLTFVNLHMKAYEDSASHARRIAASGVLKTMLDASPLDERPVVVLGDFNDGLTRSIREGAASPYENFLSDASSYRFMTSGIEARDEGTYCFNVTCSNNSAIDHILITNELFDVEMGEAFRYDALLRAIDGYTDTTSDHLPAVVRFRY